MQKLFLRPSNGLSLCITVASLGQGKQARPAVSSLQRPRGLFCCSPSNALAEICKKIYSMDTTIES